MPSIRIFAEFLESRSADHQATFYINHYWNIENYNYSRCHTTAL